MPSRRRQRGGGAVPFGAMTYEPMPSGGSGGPRISARMVLAIVLAIALLVFIAQNTGDTTVHLLWMDFSAGLWFLLLIAGFVGAGVTFLLMSWRDKRKNA